MQKTHKLYCYADETGQDTEGRFFIVVAVIVDTERDRLRQYLEQAEKSSGIGRKKWVRAKTAANSRDKYLEAANSGNFKNKIFYRSYSRTGTGAYEHLTILAIAQAVHTYREKHHIGENYKVTVTIDGLKRIEEFRVSKALRELGLLTKQVHGARDESEPLIRLADRIAGLVRESEDGRKEYVAIKLQFEKRGIISKL